MESKKPPGRKAYLNEDKTAKFLTFLSLFHFPSYQGKFKKKKPFSLKKKKKKTQTQRKHRDITVCCGTCRE